MQNVLSLPLIYNVITIEHPNENIPVNFLQLRNLSRKSDISYRVQRFYASPRPQDARIYMYT